MNEMASLKIWRTVIWSQRLFSLLSSHPRLLSFDQQREPLPRLGWIYLRPRSLTFLRMFSMMWFQEGEFVKLQTFKLKEMKLGISTHFKWRICIYCQVLLTHFETFRAAVKSFLLTISHHLNRIKRLFLFLKNKTKQTFIVFFRKTVDCCAQHIRTKIKGTNFSILTLHSSFSPQKENGWSKFIFIYTHQWTQTNAEGEVYKSRDENEEEQSGDSVPLKKKKKEAYS